MNESHRRIASINRIDELNHRTAFQNDPKRPVDSLMGRQDRPERAQEQPKTPSRRPKSPPRPSKEGPRAPKTAQEPSQEASWDGLRAILGRTDHKVKNKTDFSQTPFGFGVDFGSQMGAKTTPRQPQNESEIKTKNA